MHSFARIRILARYTSLNPFVIGFQTYSPSVWKINESSRSIDERQLWVNLVGIVGAAVCRNERKRTGGDAQTQTHARPILREIIGSPGIKIGGIPKTGSGRYTRRCTGAQTGTGARAGTDTGGRLPELWSRRSTAFGRVLKCVISDCDLSPCPDYVTSSALCPRRYALRNRAVLDAGSKVNPSISDRTSLMPNVRVWTENVYSLRTFHFINSSNSRCVFLTIGKSA